MVTYFNHGLLPDLHIELWGESISIHVEAVDALLDYKLVLGLNWFYAMQVVASSIFQIVQFPLHGRIVSIDQLDFISPNCISNDANNIPLMTTPQYQNIGVGLIKDSSLMGVFPLSNPPPIS